MIDQRSARPPHATTRWHDLDDPIAASVRGDITALETLDHLRDVLA